MFIWIILKNLVWTYKECNFYYYWAIILCIHPNIVLTKDGICTLDDVVITNLKWTDIIPQSCAIQGFIIFDVIQAKKITIAIDTPPINSSL